MRCRRPHSPRKLQEQFDRLIRNPVLRIVEEQTTPLGVHARSAIGIVREQLLDGLAAHRIRMALQGLPCRPIGQGNVAHLGVSPLGFMGVCWRRGMCHAKSVSFCIKAPQMFQCINAPYGGGIRTVFARQERTRPHAIGCSCLSRHTSTAVRLLFPRTQRRISTVPIDGCSGSREKESGLAGSQASAPSIAPACAER